ncbi:hypothetical protein JNUCC0626_19780 [Lentzea sp. JNUCC 0626]|uniref:hypothetical protein n=1 Tax=Lentzea sp. JNUCC 0626 TaxID=3367513 RepID=UPI003749EC6C
MSEDERDPKVAHALAQLLRQAQDDKASDVKGWTLQSLIDEVDISRSRWYQILNVRRHGEVVWPKAVSVASLAVSLGITAQQLIDIGRPDAAKEVEPLMVKTMSADEFLRHELRRKFRECGSFPPFLAWVADTVGDLASTASTQDGDIRSAD